MQQVQAPEQCTVSSMESLSGEELPTDDALAV